MKCAIMQPTYIPWIGYFQMIRQVDTFILLDDVQFSKRSWQQRNKIVYDEKERLISIPVKTKGLRNQKINEVKIDNSVNWKYQHLQMIKHSYGGKTYFNDLKGILDFYEEKHTNLSNFTSSLIKFIARELNIKTKFLNSSDLPVHGIKSHYLYNICEYLGATEYLSAAGSKEYIESEAVFKKSNIVVNYHQSTPYVYVQENEPTFIPYLSIIDYIANRGFKNFSKEFLS